MVRELLSEGENKPVVNTYFQTETGGILAAQRVGSNLGLSSGAISKLPEHVNMDINIMNDEIEITTPWPGCASYFIVNKEAIERYRTDEETTGCMTVDILKMTNYLSQEGR